MSSYQSSNLFPFSDLVQSSPPMSEFNFPTNPSLSIQSNPLASLSSTSVQIQAAINSQYSQQISNLDIGTGTTLSGSRFEHPAHVGPGRSVYVRQPTRAQLKSNLFSSPKRPFYYKDPTGQQFIDLDGKSHGERWIMVDLSDGEEKKSSCSIM